MPEFRGDARDASGQAEVSALRLAGSLLYVGVWPALVFVLAGDATWLEGWLFAGWFMGLCTTVILWLYRKDPALLAERYRRPGSGGQSAGDRAIVYALAVGFAGWIVVMPLDAFGRLDVASSRVAYGDRVRPLWRPQFSCFAPSVTTRFSRRSSGSRPKKASRRLDGRLRLRSAPHVPGRRPDVPWWSDPARFGPLGDRRGSGADATPRLPYRGRGDVLAKVLEGYAEYRRKVRYRLMPLVW